MFAEKINQQAHPRGGRKEKKAPSAETFSWHSRKHFMAQQANKKKVKKDLKSKWEKNLLPSVQNSIFPHSPDKKKVYIINTWRGS